MELVSPTLRTRPPAQQSIAAGGIGGLLGGGQGASRALRLDDVHVANEQTPAVSVHSPGVRVPPVQRFAAT
jgi:hypothetical protein